MSTNPRDNDDDLDDDTLDAGSEVGDDFVDDAERDAIANEREAAGKEGRDAAPESDILKAMRAATGEEEVDETAPPAKPAEQAKPDAEKPQAQQKTPEEAAAERRAEADKEADKLGLKAAARQRFHSLTEQLSDKDREIAALDQLVPPANAEDKRSASQRVTEQLTTHRQFEEAIFSTGLTAQDFGNVAAFKAALESDDPAAWEQASQFLDAQRALLDKRMGNDAGEDPLAAYPDLKAAVDGGRIDEDLAKDMAKERRRNEAVAVARQTKQQGQQQTSAIDEAADKVVAFATKTAGEEGSAQRARWDALWPKMEPALVEMQRTVPPAQWERESELIWLRLAASYVPEAPRKPEQQQRQPTVGALPRRAGGSGRSSAGDSRVVTQVQDAEADPAKSILAAMEAAQG